MTYLFYTFGTVWVGMFFYLAPLLRRSAALEREDVWARLQLPRAA